MANLLEQPNLDPDIRKRVEALMKFLTSLHCKYGPLKGVPVDTATPAFSGSGWLLTLEDGSEFYVLTDDESDDMVRANIEQFPVDAVNFDSLLDAHILSEEEYNAAKEMQRLYAAERWSAASQSRKGLEQLLRKHAEEIFQYTRSNGRGYMNSRYDDEEWLQDGYYIYCAQYQ